MYYMEIVLHMERDPISPAWAWDPTIKQNKLLNAVIISFRVLWIKHVKLMILNKIDPDLVNTHTHTHTHTQTLSKYSERLAVETYKIKLYLSACLVNSLAIMLTPCPQVLDWSILCSSLVVNIVPLFG